MMASDLVEIENPEIPEIYSDTSSIGFNGNLLLDNLEEVKIECP